MIQFHVTLSVVFRLQLHHLHVMWLLKVANQLVSAEYASIVNIYEGPLSKLISRTQELISLTCTMHYKMWQNLYTKRLLTFLFKLLLVMLKWPWELSQGTLHFFLSFFFTAKWSMHLSTFKLTYVPHISFSQLLGKFYITVNKFQ